MPASVLTARAAATVVVVGLALAGGTPPAGAASGGVTPGPAGAPQGADPLAGLTIRQLAGQRIVVGYDGTRVPAGIAARIRRGEIGGVILFARNIGARAALRAEMRRLQAIRRPTGLGAPLLVMIDQEGGLVKRLDGAPRRSPAALGRIGSAALARSEGVATAANLRSVGANVNLAPVLDVGRPGSYQQRTGRSYSSRASVVAALGSAFVRGLRAGGVAATLKHFPGLGTVTRDEDAVVQRVRLGLGALRAADEAPFAAAIAAGAEMVMTSTGRYDAFGPRPALLSPRISTTELRGRLGFRGVTITDDLNVAALTSYGGAAALGVRAAQAGNDLLLYAQSAADGARALEAMTAAVRSGAIGRASLRAAVARVLALRARL